MSEQDDLYCRATITHGLGLLSNLPVLPEAHVAVLSCDSCPMEMAVSTNKPEDVLGSDSETNGAKEVLSIGCGKWLKGSDHPGKMPEHLLSKVRVVRSPI